MSADRERGGDNACPRPALRMATVTEWLGGANSYMMVTSVVCLGSFVLADLCVPLLHLFAP